MAKPRTAPRRKAPKKKPARKASGARAPAKAKRAAKPKARAKPKASRAPSRRSKFTPARRKAILRGLALGAFRYSAASSAGVGERTLKEWIQRGRLEVEAAELADLEGSPIPAITPWGQFYLDTLAAEAKAEDLAVAVVVDTLRGGPYVETRDQLKAATWYLERKHPRRWGSGHRVELTGKDGGPLEVDARSTLLERLAKMGARKDAGAER